MGAVNLTRKQVEQVVQAMPALFGISGEADHLKDVDEFSAVELHSLLSDYFRVMEIAHYVRRGGVKAMAYRIQTGRVTFVPKDYFDEAHEQLSERFRSDYDFASIVTEGSVLEHLAAVSPEEEELVREFLPEIDQVLLADKRQEAARIEDPH